MNEEQANQPLGYEAPSFWRHLNLHSARQIVGHNV